MRAEQDRGNQAKPAVPTSPPSNDAASKERRCRRCDQVLDALERETYFERTGMCFWCAYVDSQG